MDVTAAGPLVTVGIPTYNRPGGLDRTLRQIRAQTHDRLDIIVSDNCSDNPDTRAVALAHQRADPRVRYVRQDRNIGMANNFWFVLGEARGECFMWAADDDEWTRDFVAACLRGLGLAGSVMSGLRTAVRTRDLLRWVPPLDLGPDRPFDSAVAFLVNMQPSLFYGLHRTAQIRRYAGEQMFDYYDCFFVLRQILTAGFVTVPEPCFHIGVDSEEPRVKPARPNPGRVYQYRPFLMAALREVLTAPNLRASERARLAYLAAYVTLNECSHFERAARPGWCRVASAARRALAAVRPIFRVPLPPRAETMVLPSDPGELCTMFVPRPRLSEREPLEAEVGAAQRELRAKVEVVVGLAATLGVSPSGYPERAESLIEPPPPLAPLDDLRHRLGTLLSELETAEGKIQQLVRCRDRRAA